MTICRDVVWYIKDVRLCNLCLVSPNHSNNTNTQYRTSWPTLTKPIELDQQHVDPIDFSRYPATANDVVMAINLVNRADGKPDSDFIFYHYNVSMPAAIIFAVLFGLATALHTF